MKEVIAQFLGYGSTKKFIFLLDSIKNSIIEYQENYAPNFKTGDCAQEEVYLSYKKHNEWYENALSLSKNTKGFIRKLILLGFADFIGAAHFKNSIKIPILNFKERYDNEGYFETNNVGEMILGFDSLLKSIKHEFENPEGWRKTINDEYYVPKMLVKHKKFFDNFKPLVSSTIP